MLLSVSELLKRGLEVYKAHSRLFLTYTLLISIPFAVLSFLYTFVIPPAQDAVNSVGPAEIVSFILTIIVTVWSIWVSLALVRVIWAIIKGLPIQSPKQELHNALPLLPRAIGAGILGGLLTFIGLLFLIVPGVIIGLWFTFVTQEVAIEKQTTTNALRESKRLVSGRWSAIFWRVFATAAIFFLITSIPQGLVQLIIESISRLAHLTAGSIGQHILIFIADLIGLAITVVVTPFGTATQVVFYDDAKRTAPQLKTTI